MRIALLLILSSLCAEAAEIQTIRSPDKKAVATILPASDESIVVFRDEENRTVCDQKFLSEDGEHGLSYLRGKWTPDSRFFVFTLTSSGGHSSWHFPAYAYDRFKNRILSLDRHYIKSVVDPEFRVLSPHILQIKVIDLAKPEPSNGKWIRVDLEKLLKK